MVTHLTRVQPCVNEVQCPTLSKNIVFDWLPEKNNEGLSEILRCRIFHCESLENLSRRGLGLELEATGFCLSPCNY